MTAQIPQLNLSAIEFPSDRITIGQIRREHPEYFKDYLPSVEPDWTAFNVAATIATEIVLAKNAYARATGSSADRISQAKRRDHVENLNEDYCFYGISTGLAKTQELIRDIERDVVKLAKHR